MCCFETSDRSSQNRASEGGRWETRGGGGGGGGGRLKLPGKSEDELQVSVEPRWMSGDDMDDLCRAKRQTPPRGRSQPAAVLHGGLPNAQPQPVQMAQAAVPAVSQLYPDLDLPAAEGEDSPTSPRERERERSMEGKRTRKS
ncbi:unnamed protein product [Pleuronectes platessa]|uniref:Uncharacterized protein n=1 Tax=Pleuronectes platessa TaxID=8262 RepID=A0A9N7V4X7_PLEPL|nr:unnamed protein product [Pleuronectes platessa]